MRLAEIESCAKCPHIKHNQVRRHLHICTKTGKIVKILSHFPDWCPLMSVEKVNDLVKIRGLVLKIQEVKERGVALEERVTQLKDEISELKKYP